MRRLESIDRLVKIGKTPVQCWNIGSVILGEIKVVSQPTVINYIKLETRENYKCPKNKRGDGGSFSKCACSYRVIRFSW